jgi:hypothetical protein
MYSSNIHNLGIRWRRVVTFTLLPGKEPPVPIRQEAGWASELVLTL